MQFIDLNSQYDIIKNSVYTRINRILESKQFIMGPDVIELEEKLAKYVGVDYCITCSSGTDALQMALMAYGIGPGDAVFTTSFSFFATAEVISLVGATPVFVDIEKETYNIDPIKLEVQIKKIKKKNELNPKAIIAVDLFGLVANYNEITKIAEKHNLIVVEDAAQSFGATYKSQKSGSFGDIACTSFFPAKPLGCYGDGGAIFTNNPNIHKKLLSIRIHGQDNDNKYENVMIGLNGRLDTIQAAVLLAKLEIFDEEMKKRQLIANFYSDRLKYKVNTPEINEDNQSAWAQYSVLANDEEHRNLILANLKKFNIPAMIYYPKPLHLQTAYSDLSYKEGDFPISEDISKRIFSLPMHPYLTFEEIDFITNLID